MLMRQINYNQIKQQWLKNADSKSSVTSVDELADGTEVISYWPFAMEDVEKKDAYFDGIMADFVTTRTKQKISIGHFTAPDFELHGDILKKLDRNPTEDPVKL